MRTLRELAGGHDFDCLMAIPTVKQQKWIDLLKNVLKSPTDVAMVDGQPGIELEPHVTILYGLHPQEYYETFQLFEPGLSDIATGPFEIDLKGISIFEGKDYDVVKFDVFSPVLNALNKHCKEYPHTSTFPDYHAHMTIFYANKGCGAQYIEKLKSPIQLTVSKLCYSCAAGQKVYLQL